MTDTETVEYITLEPEWENTSEWFGVALAQHAFEQFAYAPVVTFAEAIRYLALTDPKACERVIERLRRRDAV